MNQDEIEIIKKCQSGNTGEFSILYDVYIEKIYKYIYYKTGHKETAEDLTSKTFFKALRSIDKFEANESFSAWLYTIARNNVIDYYRAKKLDIDIDDIWDLSDDDDLIQSIDDKNKILEIKKYLSNLKKEQREIVILRVWQQMSYKEIAEFVGKSEDACKVTYFRVIKKLKDEMPLIVFLLLINI